MKKLLFLKAYDLILYPIVTEKSTKIGEHNQYVFAVSMDSDKKELKKACEFLFDVKVKSVNTLIRKGKQKIFRGHRGRRSDTKRAIMTLEPGHKIEFAEGRV